MFGAYSSLSHSYSNVKAHSHPVTRSCPSRVPAQVAQVPDVVQAVQALTATELNATREEELEARVAVVARCVSDGTLRVSVPIASFLTVGIVERVYSIIQQLDGKPSGMTNQHLLALVISDSLAAYCAPLPNEAEHVGNDAYSQVQDLIYKNNRFKQAKSADSSAAHRAKSKGKPPPTTSKVAKLREQYYRPFYGGTLPSGEVVPGRVVPHVHAQEKAKRARDTSSYVFDLKNISYPPPPTKRAFQYIVHINLYTYIQHP